MSIERATSSFNQALDIYQRTWPDNVRVEGAYPDIAQPGREEPFSAKVEKFGREWIVTRENFIFSTIDSLISAIHCFVLALIDSGFALIKGEAKDDALNKKAIQSWSDTGLALRYVGQSFVGIAAPSIAIKIHNFINEKMKPAEPEQTNPV